MHFLDDGPSPRIPAANEGSWEGPTWLKIPSNPGGDWPEKWIVGRLSFWGGKRSIFRGYNGYRLYICFWGGYVMVYVHHIYIYIYTHTFQSLASFLAGTVHDNLLKQSAGKVIPIGQSLVELHDQEALAM